MLPTLALIPGGNEVCCSSFRNRCSACKEHVPQRTGGLASATSGVKPGLANRPAGETPCLQESLATKPPRGFCGASCVWYGCRLRHFPVSTDCPAWMGSSEVSGPYEAVLVAGFRLCPGFIQHPP